MIDKIEQFLDKKGINDELVRNVLKYYIIEHTNILGNIIPIDEVMQRLDTNLEKITFKKEEEKYGNENMMAQYVGFKENSINLYLEKEYLNGKLKQDFIDILVHELTHAIYTKKNNDLYESETQVFCTMEKVGDRVEITKGDDY